MFNFPLEKTRKSAELDIDDVWEDTGRFKGANQLNEVSFRGLNDIQKAPSNDSSDILENLSDQSSLSVHILRHQNQEPASSLSPQVELMNVNSNYNTAPIRKGNNIYETMNQVQGEGNAVDVDNIYVTQKSNIEDRDISSPSDSKTNTS